MGKKDKTTEAVEGTENTEATEGTEAPKKGGKAIVLTLADGTEIKRSDYIRKRADEGAARSLIAKELTDLQGKEVVYQVVFAATKNHPTYAKKATAETGSESTGTDGTVEGTADAGESVDDLLDLEA